MKEEKIRVLALLPTEYARMVTIDNTLEAMQQFVGGLIECLPMDDPEADIVLVCNDVGKFYSCRPTVGFGAAKTCWSARLLSPQGTRRATCVLCPMPR